MAIHISQDIGSKLIAALGLPKNVIWLELRVAVDEFVKVKCEYFPERQDGLPVEAVFAEYKVVRRETAAESAQVPQFNFDAWLKDQDDAAHAAMLDRHRSLSEMDVRQLCNG